MRTVKLPKFYRNSLGRYHKMVGAILLQEVEDGKLKRTNDQMWTKLGYNIYDCYPEFNPITFLDKIYDERMGGFYEVTLEELRETLYARYNIHKIYKQILYYAELNKYREKLALKLEKRESENKENYD